MKIVALYFLLLILFGRSYTTTWYLHDIRFVDARTGEPYRYSLQGIIWETAKEFGYYYISSLDGYFGQDMEPGDIMHVFRKTPTWFPKKGTWKDGAFDTSSIIFWQIANRVILENASSDFTPFLKLVRDELMNRARQKHPDVQILERGILKKIKVSPLR